MTRTSWIMTGGLAAGVACSGCKAPIVQVNKFYFLEQNGLGTNEVKVTVDKDETVSPQIEGKVTGIEASATATATANVTGNEAKVK